jgi:hypothetical protein
MPTYTQKEKLKGTDPARSQRKYVQSKLNPIGQALEAFSPLELGFTLDCSESMQGIWDVAVRGFNMLLSTQPRTPGVDARFSSSLFNGIVKPIHTRTPLALVEPLDPAAHRPNGATAILDAIGKMCQVIGKAYDEAEGAVKPRVLIAILTDGNENSSIHFTVDQIFREVHFRRLACNWQFLYFCANEGGVAYGLKLGIQRSNITTFDADPAGIAILMGRVAAAMSAYALGDRNFQRFLLPG